MMLTLISKVEQFSSHLDCTKFDKLGILLLSFEASLTARKDEISRMFD